MQGWIQATVIIMSAIGTTVAVNGLISRAQRRDAPRGDCSITEHDALREARAVSLEVKRLTQQLGGHA